MKVASITQYRTSRRLAGALLCYLTLQTSGLAQAPWGSPLTQPGIAAATCAGPTNDASGASIPASAAYTFGLVDLRSPGLPDYGGCVPTAPLWNAPMYHHSTWNAEDLGNVYGITYDARGHIYLAAHGLYGAYRPLHHRYGDIGGGASDLSAAGTVYKVDRVSGAVSVFAVVPGQQAMALSGGLVSGPGLGNVTYDAVHNQFFTTSLEDGKIYRINASGSIVQTFDPMGVDTGAVGLPPKNERLWGIEVHRGAVYYSVWNSGSVTDPAKIRKVNILASGALNPSSDTEILTIPGKTYSYHSIPIADLTFSNDGRTMVLGERSMLTPIYSYNHRSSTHLAELSGGTWTVTKTLATGCNVPDGEAYGGVAFGNFGGDPEGTIWSTSADMRSGYGPHGLFGVQTADFPVSGKADNSWKVPYDPGYTDHYLNDLKGSGGDIEILNDTRCANLRVGQIDCPDNPDAPYETTLSITNLSANTAVYAVLTPCPVDELPNNATTGQPRPTGVITLPSPISTGDTTTINIAIPANAGSVFCFQVTLLTSDGEECCTEKTCVTLPECGCAELVEHKIDCEVLADGTVKYTIVMAVKNLTALDGAPYPFGYATILPPAGFSPSLLSPTGGPIAPGATGILETCYYGAPGKRCFDLALHDPNFTTCCSIEVCLDLPDCGDIKPDTCAIRSRIACCPPDGVTTVPFTICNNASVPRTYTWTASGFASATCTQTLTSAHFSPSSGTLGPIPPGGCLTGTLKVRCDDFDFGDCARFKIAFTHSASVPELCCISEVYRPRADRPVIKIDEPLFTVPIGGLVPVKVTLSNPGTSILRIPVLFFSEDGALDLGEGEPGPIGAELIGTTTRVVSLSPGSSQEISIPVRLPADAGVPFAPLAIYIGAESIEDIAKAGQPIVIPIRAGALRNEVAVNVAALRVDDINVVHGERPEVIMRVPTILGHRYRVEQSDSLEPGWKVSTCNVQDVVTGPDGVFVGTGGQVTCKVPCGADEGLMFFRIRDLSLD